MSYQGPPSWKVPPPGGWPQQPQPQQQPMQQSWQQPPQHQMQPWQQPPQQMQYAPQQQWPAQPPVMMVYAPTCPCGYSGPTVVRGGVNVLAAMVLCFLCLIPGLIYVVTSKEEHCCPRCSARLR